jgi:predicted aspartyl protease
MKNHTVLATLAGLIPVLAIAQQGSPGETTAAPIDAARSATWDTDADSLFARGRLDAARAAFIERLARSPGDEDAQRSLGIIALWTNHLDEAGARLAPLVGKHPTDTLLTTALIEIRLRQRRYGEAVALYPRSGHNGLVYATALRAAGPEAYAVSIPDAGTRLDFVGNDEVPVVRIKINGHEGSFILDTGSHEMFLDSAFAAAAGVHTVGSIAAMNVGGVPSRDGVGVIDAMQIGAATIRHVPTGITNPEMPLGPTIDGLLGFDVLINFRLTVNYIGRSVRLERRGRPRTPMAREMAVPLWIGSSSRPMVPVILAGRDTAPLLLDTGMEGGIASGPTMIERLPVAVDATGNESILGTSGMIHGITFTVAHVQIGPITRESVPGIAGILSSDALDFTHFWGLVAGGFFDDHQIIVDPDAMQLIVSGGATPNP